MPSMLRTFEVSNEEFGVLGMGLLIVRIVSIGGSV